jgi:hypothetical protein
MGIDFVITWVDMNDPAWQESFAACSGKIQKSKNEMSVARFRDYGFLKYWFRGVEKFAPWVRKVHFVTCGQTPEWLNAGHPKLQLVNHEDYIPKSCLPCFNSNVLEFYLHKIPDLAEHFVYFNDDFFITNTVPDERFFTGGLPNDIATFRLNTGFAQWNKMLKNNIVLINRQFDKRLILERDKEKWLNKVYGSKARLTRLLQPYGKFITLRTPHNAQAFLKQTFDEVWAAFEPELTRASTYRFRTSQDLTPELFRTWQICQSNFVPYNTYSDTKMFPLILKSEKAIRAIRNQSYSLICLNDNENIRNYQETMRKLGLAFESILPGKSSFEV